MMQQAINYAKALYDLIPDKDAVDAVKEMFTGTPLLARVLEDPMVSLKKKHQIIEDLARKTELAGHLKNFLKYLCDHRDVHMLPAIAEEYDALWEEKHNILQATLLYARSPEERELDEAKTFLKKKYPDKEIHTTLCIQEELLGGLCIHVGHTEYDWSYEGRLKELERKLTVR